MSNISAICYINETKCKGIIKIKEINNRKMLEFKINLRDMEPGLHGFHIHEAGNLSEGCSSCCAHFNPHNKKHGGPNSKERHLGDLGNIKVDKNGNCKMTLYDKELKLRGSKYNIIGRSIVVHEDADDLGLGGNAESLRTGNAGKRIGCGVIGYEKGFYF